MEDLLKVLINYSKEAHIEKLYSEIPKINFRIKPLYSANWTNQTWLASNEIPYVTLTNLMDSYLCLPERPDMAFTHIWKSINNSYLKTGKTIRVATSDNSKLNDSDGIQYLVKGIENVKNRQITSTLTVLQLVENYIDIIPIKSIKFVANFLLKGYAIEKSGINKVLNSSSYNSFRKNHRTLFDGITLTYGESYKRITSPIEKVYRADLNISDKHKSRSIPESLSIKLMELMKTRTTTITDSAKTNTTILSLTNDEEFLDVIIRVILYSIRNNSVHGNLVSRLNSEFVNIDSLKNSIYIYFLAHLILSLNLYINGEIALNELDINVQNLSILQSALA